MPSIAYMNGLSSVSAPFAVVVSDYDGSDMVETMKDELDRMSDEPECQGRPIPVYAVSGMLGSIRTEVFYLYMLGGVPLILDPGVLVEGGDDDNADMVARSGRFIEAMYAANNTHVYSIGFVGSPDEAYSYAVEFTRHSVPSKDTGIDESIVNSYIGANPNSVTHVGTIQKPGGTRFDVYAVTETESAMFRPNKDFMGGEPDVEDWKEGERGPIEVILCGGNPDIVCVGGICSMDGWMFDVWVPNEVDYVDCAMHMVEQGDIPQDTLYVDEDELAQAYVMYLEKLRMDEAEADNEVESEEETDVPDFDYEEYYSEMDRDREEGISV